MTTPNFTLSTTRKQRALPAHWRAIWWGSATSDRHRDLVAPPEREGPGRIVELPDQRSGRLEGSVLQCIQQLSGARCDGGRPTVAGEAEHGHRFFRNGDEADLVVVGLGQCVHGPAGRHEEP